MNSSLNSRPDFAEEDPMEYNFFVLGLSLAGSILSIFGSLVIFATYITLPEIQTCVRKLIACLTMADFITAASIFLGASNFAINNTGDTTTCKIQSYITTYSSLVSFNLTVMTALHIFTTVTKKTDFAQRKRLVLYNAISWIIPAVIIVVAGNQQVLGTSGLKDNGPWCWIKKGSPHKEMWQWVTGKGWEIACYLITTSLYILLKLHLHFKHQQERFHTVHTSLRDEDQNFLYVWFVFYIIRLWGTVRFLSQVIHPQIEVNGIYMKVLLHLQAFGDPAQAFCNCILFCFLDKTVRTRLLRTCSNKVCRYKELRESNIGDDSRSDNRGEHTPETKPVVGPRLLDYGSTEHEDFSMKSYINDNGDTLSCRYMYDSPISAPCMTPRGSPASFNSVFSEH